MKYIFFKLHLPLYEKKLGEKSFSVFLFFSLVGLFFFNLCSWPLNIIKSFFFTFIIIFLVISRNQTYLIANRCKHTFINFFLSSNHPYKASSSNQSCFCSLIYLLKLLPYSFLIYLYKVSYLIIYLFICFTRKTMITKLYLYVNINFTHLPKFQLNIPNHH